MDADGALCYPGRATMLPAQRRAVVRRVVVGALVSVAAFLVARATRALLHEQQVFLAGENGMRHWEAARASFARGDGFPLWDRATCGGGPSLGDPESLVLSSLVAGVFRIHGDVLGRWYPTLGATLGIVGTYLWCRDSLGIGRVGAFWAGVVFVASGFLSLQTAGRMMLVPLTLIPWVLYLARRGETDLRAAALAGAVLALIVLEGGILPIVQAWVALLLVTLPRPWARGVGAVRVLRGLGVVVAAFVLVAGVKLFPVLVQIARWPAHPGGLDALQWSELMPIFGDKERFDPLANHRFHYNEYRAYVGPLVLGCGLAGAGVAVILAPRRWGVALLALGGLLFMRGATSPAAPYALLYEVLPWNALLVPSRFVVIAVLGIGAAGGVAIDAALGIVARRRGLALVVLAVAAVGAWDPIAEGTKILKAQGTQPWLPRPDPKAGSFMLVDEGLGRVAEFPARNVGAAACERLLDTPVATGLVPGPRPQAWPDEPNAGVLIELQTTQNGYAFHARLARAATVHVNTTFDPDWTTNVGTIRRAAQGSLDVMLPAGETDVRLRYRPRGLWPGLAATVLGLLGVGALCVWPLVRRRRRLAHRAPAAPPPRGGDPVTTSASAPA